MIVSVRLPKEGHKFFTINFCLSQVQGLQTAYSGNDAEYRYIRKLMALRFLPHHEIRPMFVHLSVQAETQPLCNHWKNWQISLMEFCMDSVWNLCGNRLFSKHGKSTIFPNMDFILIPIWIIQIPNLGNCDEELPKKPVGQLSVDCRPSVGRLSAACWPTVGRLLADCWPSVSQQTADRFSPKHRLSIGRQSADKRPTVGRQLVMYEAVFISKILFPVFVIRYHVFVIR